MCLSSIFELRTTLKDGVGSIRTGQEEEEEGVMAKERMRVAIIF